MSQKFKPKKPPDPIEPAPGLKFKAREKQELPQTEGLKDRIDQILAKPELKCCGILPCKGRQPGCFTCILCMDCITGRGCGHDDSNHTYRSGEVQS